MKFILNIGLDPEVTPEIAAHVALEIVKASEFLVGSHVVVGLTLAVRVQYRGTSALLCLRHLRNIATDLQRDCIAVYRPLTRQGAIVGPRAALYGTFNPSAFVMPNGTTLAKAQAA